MGLYLCLQVLMGEKILRDSKLKTTTQYGDIISKKEKS